MTEVLLWVITGLMVLYAAIDLADIWRNRPVVMWDEQYQRWRAKRGIKVAPPDYR